MHCRGSGGRGRSQILAKAVSAPKGRIWAVGGTEVRSRGLEDLGKVWGRGAPRAIGLGHEAERGRGLCGRGPRRARAVSARCDFFSNFRGAPSMSGHIRAPVGAGSAPKGRIWAVGGPRFAFVPQGRAAGARMCVCIQWAPKVRQEIRKKIRARRFGGGGPWASGWVGGAPMCFVCTQKAGAYARSLRAEGVQKCGSDPPPSPLALGPNARKMLAKCSQNAREMLAKCSQNARKMLAKCS